MGLTNLIRFEHEAEHGRQTQSVRDKVQTYGPMNFEYLSVNVVVYVTIINHLQHKPAASWKYTDGKLLS